MKENALSLFKILSVKTLRVLLLCLLSGLLLAFSWFPHGWSPLLFIAFVPLLIAEQKVLDQPGKYPALTLFAGSYLAFFLWNILVTWWVKNASFGGAAMAILCNALLMCFVFMFYHRLHKRIGSKFAPFLLVACWISFEYFHLDWDLTWPWLTLGNAFAGNTSLIQWYEYTGVFGGSLWVLVLNMLFFSLLKQRNGNYFLANKRLIISLSAVLLIPIVLSFWILQRVKTNEGPSVNVVVVQPNIDPYNEKFSGNYQDQLIRMIGQAREQLDSTTEFLLFPETALTEDLWEEHLEQSFSIQQLRLLLRDFPKLKIITGASTAKIYQPGEPVSSTARQFINDATYYDAYNTALMVEKDQPLQIYHKSKLVPGVEKMPFPFIFKYIEKFAIDLGGTSGSLGVQDNRTAFHSVKGNVAAAPVICYESIYGEFVSAYVNDGAQFIAIITNDGWWGDTPGYHQHLQYGALRAIETRKWIARSANTGISCFIDPSGSILQATNWWTPAVIRCQIHLTPGTTFYTRHGDYIATMAWMLALALILFSLVLRFRLIRS